MVWPVWEAHSLLRTGPTEERAAVEPVVVRSCVMVLTYGPVRVAMEGYRVFRARRAAFHHP